MTRGAAPAKPASLPRSSARRDPKPFVAAVSSCRPEVSHAVDDPTHRAHALLRRCVQLLATHADRARAEGHGVRPRRSRSPRPAGRVHGHAVARRGPGARVGRRLRVRVVDVERVHRRAVARPAAVARRHPRAGRGALVDQLEPRQDLAAVRSRADGRRRHPDRARCCASSTPCSPTSTSACAITGPTRLGSARTGTAPAWVSSTSPTRRCSRGSAGSSSSTGGRSRPSSTSLAAWIATLIADPVVLETRGPEAELLEILEGYRENYRRVAARR